MRYGSVCSGIEAATVAWHPLGWQPAWFSEIEKFPSAVLAHHYPDVPNLGDMTRFEEWPDDAIDLLVGGTPCQSFSVAGLRAGLADPRGNLMLTYLAIAARYRPRWVVWENVPGVLSSNKERDFGAFLRGLGECGYGFGYRVLDAQYCRASGIEHAVPQRRRRVFVVGYLGNWRRAAAVLFDAASLRGDPPPRREAGASVAALTSSGVGTCGADDNQAQAGHLICANSGDIGYCLTASAQQSQDAETETLVAQPVAFEANMSLQAPDSTGVHPTITRRTHAAVAFAQNQRDEIRVMDVSGALAAEPGTKQQTYLAQPWAVRRLTPTECERLQGFPDGYTDIPYRGKRAADGPRYKALGNSMAVNVMRVLGERIQMVDNL